MVLAVSKIEKDAEDKVSTKAIQLFVRQIVKAIHTACGGDIELAKKIERQIDKDVRLPKEGEDLTQDCTTTATASDFVLEMDKVTLGVDNETSDPSVV